MSLRVASDHIGYKCADSTEFESLRSLLEKESSFLYQSFISQRRISIIKLLHPLKTAYGEIGYLELSDQKPNGSQISGFDHIEVYPLEGTVEGLVQVLQREGVSFNRIERPHHTTYDSILIQGFSVRLEAGPLVEKIKAMEMR